MLPSGSDLPGILTKTTHGSSEVRDFLRFLLGMSDQELSVSLVISNMFDFERVCSGIVEERRETKRDFDASVARQCSGAEKKHKRCLKVALYVGLREIETVL